MSWFKNKKEILDIAGSFSSVIALIIYFISNATGFLTKSNNPAVPFAIQNAIMMLGLLGWGIWYTMKSIYLRRELNELNNINKNISVTLKNRHKKIYYDTIKKIHLFCHNYRNLSVNLKPNQDQSDIRKTIVPFLINTCNSIKEIFDFLTKENCTVTIKSLKTTNSVVTTVRDSQGIIDRKNISHLELRIADNTAFHYLQESEKDCFLHNNLLELEYYQNQNPQWKEFYNRALVVPIRYPRTGDNPPNLVGYLAVDCKTDKGGQTFNDTGHKEILAIFADALYIFIKNFSPSLRQGEPSKGESNAK